MPLQLAIRFLLILLFVIYVSSFVDVSTISTSISLFAFNKKKLTSYILFEILKYYSHQNIIKFVLGFDLFPCSKCYPAWLSFFSSFENLYIFSIFEILDSALIRLFDPLSFFFIFHFFLIDF